MDLQYASNSTIQASFCNCYLRMRPPWTERGKSEKCTHSRFADCMRECAQIGVGQAILRNAYSSAEIARIRKRNWRLRQRRTLKFITLYSSETDISITWDNYETIFIHTKKQTWKQFENGQTLTNVATPTLRKRRQTGRSLMRSEKAGSFSSQIFNYL